MPTLTICRGLPGSGKSTWAREQEQLRNCVVVTRDDIRANFVKNGWEWSHHNEKKDVVPERDRQIREALSRGVDVISADTNIADKTVNQLKQIAYDCNADIYVKNFFDVSVEECIKRDAAREKPVGEKVIRGMAAQLAMNPEFLAEKVIQDPNLPRCIICDLDGTLALLHRNPYDTARCFEDEVNEPIVGILNAAPEHVSIIYVSGRDDTYRDLTQEWLDKKAYAPHGQLLMRRAGDRRDDRIVKRELFDREIAGKFYVDFVLDDRNKVVKMWRDMGLTCLQVAEGNF